MKEKRIGNKRSEILIKGLLTLVLIIAITVGVSGIDRLIASADGGFELVESYPKDGATNAAVENLGVKLTFSSELGSTDNQAANDKCFTLTGPEGDTLPIKVYYNPKDATQILVLYDSTTGGAITSRKSEHYKIKISGDLMDNAGNTLGDDVNIEFDTINQSFNTRVYMVIMLLMMAGMAFFTTRQTQKKMAEEGIAKEEAFNPYKEAKRTGKSVEEVMAIHEKEVAKAEAKAAKKNVREYDEDYDELEDYDNGNYKVKGPRPISAGGSTYITGRKALAEAKKAEEERLAKRRANAKKKK